MQAAAPHLELKTHKAIVMDAKSTGNLYVHAPSGKTLNGSHLPVRLDGSHRPTLWPCSNVCKLKSQKNNMS